MLLTRSMAESSPAHLTLSSDGRRRRSMQPSAVQVICVASFCGLIGHRNNGRGPEWPDLTPTIYRIKSSLHRFSEGGTEILFVQLGHELNVRLRTHDR